MRNDLAKEAAGRAAAHMIESGMVVGLGTGSTASCFIESLSRRCYEGLHITAVATSKESEAHARAAGIPLLELDRLTTLDITVDGADEVDQKKRLIKGGGGALLREKVIASLSKEMVVVVDESKKVDWLGALPLPLEILPFAHEALLFKLHSLGYQAQIRRNRKEDLFVTDNGNYIIDIHFREKLKHPEKEQEILRNIPGVLETGFFLNMAGRIVIGRTDGSVEVLK